jgi:Asp/Glu/hydantoin racemase
MTIKIALIHAVAVAVAPVEDAFKRLWPEVDCLDLLDETLSVDRAKAGRLTPELIARIGAMAGDGRKQGADAILYTCSAFGPAIEAVARRLPCPVLKPNEAMFEAALEAGTRIGMIATFEASVASMEEEFRAAAAASGKTATIETVCVLEAMAALQRGDAEMHNRLCAEAAAKLPACDAIMLAQFSTSRARDAVTAATRVPVLTSPDSAVAKLRPVLENNGSDPTV